MKSVKSEPEKRADWEQLLELVRAELRVSFWQGVALALAIFILSLFAVLLLQK